MSKFQILHKTSVHYDFVIRQPKTIFHQRIFQYIDNCRVPDNGKEGGWDVIFHNEEGIDLPDGDRVRTIYVEMKNKHNTMNSSSAGKTYIKMQNRLL